MEKELEKIKKALIFSAHPDDLDFGCAGTVAKLTGAGVEVVYCIITDGSKGIQKEEDFGSSKEKMFEMRDSEQKNAAKAVGVTKVLNLEEVDGELENTAQTREKIAGAIREEKPDVVFAFDPGNRGFENFYKYHRDHRMGGEAVFDAIYPGAGSPAYFLDLAKQGLPPHQISELWLYATEKADIFIDISDTIDKKTDALRCHVSQFKDTNEMEKRVKQRASETGKDRNMQYAESFRVLGF